MTILPVTYFGPVGWWNKLDVSDTTVFDINENYIKQTYRNRWRILSCNGLLTLSIPVKKVDGNHTLLKNMRIDNYQNWQIRHYRAVLSAYKASAFFDYYIDPRNKSAHPDAGFKPWTYGGVLGKRVLPCGTAYVPPEDCAWMVAEADAPVAHVDPFIGTAG
ncbi:MAG: WbqC family protein, partial [Bacteroidales bacterium]|nr:WbqC family protein [Bacteroidales bacterium]